MKVKPQGSNWGGGPKNSKNNFGPNFHGGLLVPIQDERAVNGHDRIDQSTTVLVGIDHPCYEDTNVLRHPNFT